LSDAQLGCTGYWVFAIGVYQKSAFRISNSEFSLTMALQKSPKRLAKLLDYILGRRPDEFGLVTDSEGYIKIKELLKALSEEEGLSYVRRAHLDEILITLPDPSFEISDNTIRAKSRRDLPAHAYAPDPPKLLYHCIRQKAYPHVYTKGINPTGYSQVILSSNLNLAQRMGKRIDRSAILLTVQVQPCLDKGGAFFAAGEALFLADFIPPDCFSGPPLPKEKPAVAKPAEQQTLHQQGPAGSYFIDLDEKFVGRVPKSKRTGKDGKFQKKPKRKRERPPWRR
jgi:putative RNA 2'-phosphotransferase